MIISYQKFAGDFNNLCSVSFRLNLGEMMGSARYGGHISYEFWESRDFFSVPSIFLSN